MIFTEKKPKEEILGYLEEHQKIFLVGCGICATTWKTGGEPEAQEMATLLKDAGKVLVGWVVPKEATCDLRISRLELQRHAQEVAQADAILVLACGAGAQTVASLARVPTYPALNTSYLGRLMRLDFSTEQCRLCGECLLAYTGGICPVTLCPKSLMNGPCGGYRDGKCEVDPEKDCAWVLIYQRLQEWGQGERFSRILPPKDWSQMRHPKSIDKRHVPVEVKG